MRATQLICATPCFYPPPIKEKLRVWVQTMPGELKSHIAVIMQCNTCRLSKVKFLVRYCSPVNTNTRAIKPVSHPLYYLPLHAVERLIRDNCQIDGDDLINYTDFVQSIGRRFEDMDSEHHY